MEKQVRTNRINLRVTDDEAQALQEKAAAYGLPVGSYVRLEALKRKLPDVAEIVALRKEELKQSFGALNNLNQIAKRLNSGDDAQQDLREIIEYFRARIRNAKGDS